jgi:3-hydroxyisobutyrate dehydrogenase-like beta-hydroxyacid dehydrogenase
MNAKEKLPPVPSTSCECIGLVGLGLMGSAIAERLLGGGFEVCGWDVSTTQRSALEKIGGRVAVDSASVFRRCERIILSLPDDKVVSTVLREANDTLRDRHMVIDSSTGSPESTEALGRRLESRGVIYFDATISGSSVQVRSGEALIMVGGPTQAVGRCQDLFRLFANQVIHTGPCGSGAKMKLVTNLVLGLNRAALAEGLVFARVLGLDGVQALKVLRESMAYSRIMDTKGEKMLRGDFEPQAKLSQHLKDVRLILESATGLGAKLPLSETHRHLLELAETAGLGQLDNSAIIRAIESLKDPQS